ncbi:hypothetical protein [Aquisalimonas sp.]|nr:hypothetical protein [Aquisalimonas sp.]
MAATIVIAAFAVYQRLGVAGLRHAWFNTDHLWAGGVAVVDRRPRWLA